MIRSGIDYSMTCPSIAIWDSKKSLEFKNIHFFYYINKKKYACDFGHNIHGFMIEPYESEEERFSNITKWASIILSRFSVQHVVLEGYSLGSKGKVFNIAENTGLFKNWMWKNSIEFITPPPTVVKKFFALKGNANKEKMVDTFTEKTGICLAKLFDTKSKTIAPINDIVDSYAMLEYGVKMI